MSTNFFLHIDSRLAGVLFVPLSSCCDPFSFVELWFMITVHSVFHGLHRYHCLHILGAVQPLAEWVSFAVSFYCLDFPFIFFSRRFSRCSPWPFSSVPLSQDPYPTLPVALCNGWPDCCLVLPPFPLEEKAFVWLPDFTHAAVYLMTRAHFSEVTVVAVARSCSCHWSDCVCQDTRADIMLPHAGLSLAWVLFIQPFEFYTRVLAHGLCMLQSHAVFIE